MTIPTTDAHLDTRALELREESDAKVADLTRRLDAIDAAATDAIADTRSLTTQVVPDVAPMDRVQLVAATPNGAMRIRILDGAHRQIAAKTNIPWTYYERMLEDAPQLAAQNIGHWFAAEPARRLLRMLAPISEQDRVVLGKTDAHVNLRAVLSDRYRPLANTTLLRVALDEFEKRDAFLTDWSLDEQRLFLRGTNDPRDTGEIVAEARRRAGIAEGESTHKFVNERVAFGVALKNSETGHSMLDVDPFAMILRCLNGLICAERMGVMHVGRKASEEEAWQGDTRRLDDAATFLKVRDRIGEALAPETAARVASRIEDAASKTLALPPAQPVFEFVGNVGRKLDLSDREVEMLKQEVGAEVAGYGSGLPRPLSVFAMSQGITATARQAEDFGRRVELESLGWKVLGNTIEELLRAGGTITDTPRARRRAATHN